MNLEEAFIQGEKLSELRTKNQEKALQDFYERKRFNEMEKREKLNENKNP